MTARAFDPAGLAGAAAFAAPLFRRWRALLGALLLTLTPGLASAAEEWPTTPDRGPGTETRIPWLRFSGDPNAPVQVLGEVGHGREVVVLREQPPSARQRRLLRRAERHADKAAKLRKQAGAGQPAYAVVVPVVRPAAAAPRMVVIDQRRPQVQVVRHEREDEGCEQREAHAHAGPGAAGMHVPVVIDAERLAREVERDVAREMERAHREVERAAARMQRDAERAERDSERAERDAERVQREVERAHREAERAARAGVKAAERALRDAKKATKRGG